MGNINLHKYFLYAFGGLSSSGEVRYAHISNTWQYVANTIKLVQLRC